MAPHGIPHGGRRIGRCAVAVWSRGVTHDELRSLLAPYAAGTLPPDDAETLRRHLATGCTTCLDALFRLPVGLPRVSEQEMRPAAEPIAAAPPARASGTPWIVTLVLLIALLASLVWMLEQRRDLHRLQAEVDDLDMRLESVQRDRTAFSERLESRGRELAEARANP